MIEVSGTERETGEETEGQSAPVVVETLQAVTLDDGREAPTTSEVSTQKSADLAPTTTEQDPLGRT